MPSSISRRGALATLAALALTPIAARGALAQSAVRVARITVDVSRARARRGDPTARWVAEAMPQSAARALGPRFVRDAPGGAVLTIHIDDVRLATMRTGGARTVDEIQGSVSLTGPGLRPRGGVIRTIATFRASARDVPMRVEANRRRVDTLVGRFTQEIPRKLGL